MRFREAAGYIADAVAPAVLNVPEGQVRELVERIRAADKVIIFGRGRSGLVGRALAIRLVHLGVHAYVVGETITPPVREGDLVILISGSGETFSVVVTGQIARDLGCAVVTVTGRSESTLGEMGDLVVELATPKEPLQRELAPLGTLFEDAAGLFFDGLVAELMHALHETEDGMRKRHATLE